MEPSAYDVWHDRAVFHFLTVPEQRSAYIRQVAHAVKSGDHVIIATFGPEGPAVPNSTTSIQSLSPQRAVPHRRSPINRIEELLQWNLAPEFAMASTTAA